MDVKYKKMQSQRFGTTVMIESIDYSEESDISLTRKDKLVTLSTGSNSEEGCSIQDDLTEEEFVELVSNVVNNLGFTDEVILALSKSKQEES